MRHAQHRRPRPRKPNGVSSVVESVLLVILGTAGGLALGAVAAKAVCGLDFLTVPTRADLLAKVGGTAAIGGGALAVFGATLGGPVSLLGGALFLGSGLSAIGGGRALRARAAALSGEGSAPLVAPA